MTYDAIEAEIIRMLREELLFGSGRSISAEMTFAELGLDSLATIQLITAVESAYDVEVAEGILTAERPVTLGQLAKLVGDRPMAPERPEPPVDARPMPPLVHRIERLEHLLAGRGLMRSAAWALLRITWPWLRFAYSPPSEYVILERALDDGGITQFSPPADVELRPYVPADRPALTGLWPDFLARSAGQSVDAWLADGAVALVAEEGGRIVGLDVISAAGERGEVTVRSDRGAAWGLYLREAPQAQGRRIGLALLAFSLRDAHARGFRTQLTSVRRNNSPMLAATTQFLGFRSIGRATRLVLLGRTRWRWEVDGRAGRGPQLRL